MERIFFIFCLIFGLTGNALAKPEVDVRVHSAECRYTLPEGEACFTLRLHVQTSSESSLGEPTASPDVRTPLIGVDAVGHPLVGVLRAVESCMEQCRILVYDFYAHPQGGWIEFDTHILLPISSSSYNLVTEPFDPRLPGTTRVWGHTLFRTPLPIKENEAKEHAVIFRQEYESAPLLRRVSFCNADGTPCRSRVLSAEYDENSGMTSGIYLLHPSGATVRLVLRCMHPALLQPVRVRMRIFAGGVSQP